MTPTQRFDAVILGAGAAGLFCAAEAAATGGRVLLIDHARAPGEKIRISGGGRCNFTNMGCGPHAFISENPHFAKSALSRYTQWDFIDLVAGAGIAYHEKTLGQLFCDGSAREIIRLLTDRLAAAGGTLWLSAEVGSVDKVPDGFRLQITRDGRECLIETTQLVIATGGKSIPKMGASDFGYRIARQFGHEIVETRPALVPLTFGDGTIEPLRDMAGISADVSVSANGQSFREALLFTHRGLSGPAILQISSYWRPGQAITVDLMPGGGAREQLRDLRQSSGARSVGRSLASILPQKLARHLVGRAGLTGNLADQSDADLQHLVTAATAWKLWPTGTEGYRTAEVTAGGVDTGGVSSRTMQSTTIQGLYFIGEVLDVTGWLGGYNFQWAWSSGWAAGQAVAERITSLRT